MPEATSGQNRLHLDLASPTEAVQAATVARARELGAVPVDIGQYAGRGVPWVVLADPEGNEFCVLTPREHPPADRADRAELGRLESVEGGHPVG